MNALCKRCETNIVSGTKEELSVLMVAHILSDHCQEEKYSGVIRTLLEMAKEDYIVDFED